MGGDAQMAGDDACGETETERVRQTGRQRDRQAGRQTFPEAAQSEVLRAVRALQHPLPVGGAQLRPELYWHNLIHEEVPDR